MTSPPDAARLQANLAEFAIAELVRSHRGSFAPLWTQESWAKLLIWLALNCGCSGDRAGLEAFAAALPAPLSRRLRQLYFGRERADLGLRLLADPAEADVLVVAEAGAEPLTPERAATALAQADLLEHVVPDREQWRLEARLVRVPWAPCN
jgi:hypothetical protein